MATNFDQAQGPVLYCKNHDNEFLIAYCRLCSKRICEACIKNEHKEHDWCAMEKIIREMRAKAEEKSAQIQNLISEMKKASKEASEKRTEEIRKIRAVQQKMNDIINSHADRLVAKLDVETDDITEEIKDLEKMAKFFARDIKQAHDSVVFDVQEEYTKKAAQSARKLRSQRAIPTFREGVIDVNAIVVMFGSISSNIFGKLFQSLNFFK